MLLKTAKRYKLLRQERAEREQLARSGLVVESTIAESKRGHAAFKSLVNYGVFSRPKIERTIAQELPWAIFYGSMSADIDRALAGKSSINVKKTIDQAILKNTGWVANQYTVDASEVSIARNKEGLSSAEDKLAQQFLVRFITGATLPMEDATRVAGWPKLVVRVGFDYWFNHCLPRSVDMFRDVGIECGAPIVVRRSLLDQVTDYRHDYDSLVRRLIDPTEKAMTLDLSGELEANLLGDLVNQFALPVANLTSKPSVVSLAREKLLSATSYRMKLLTWFEFKLASVVADTIRSGSDSINHSSVVSAISENKAYFEAINPLLFVVRAYRRFLNMLLDCMPHDTADSYALALKGEIDHALMSVNRWESKAVSFQATPSLISKVEQCFKQRLEHAL